MRPVVTFLTLLILSAAVSSPVARATSLGQPTAHSASHRCAGLLDFYDVRARNVSCAKARRVLRKVATTSCRFDETCSAGGFVYTLAGPRMKTIARRGNQTISWRSTFSD